ncbi:MAG: bifunctional precorrin-2 dehydrogenase/sirohydrochlorin ferrochelatase [Lachnospiraceae bacterium]|nr:bifunctional precorrin-2 dehydrogenase/sirohydrochlorin ferrochelatase [Lachnospiraceae bacterium]
MAYFPIYVNLEQKRILIVGGGRVALRKVKVLLEYGPKILVVAPEIEEELCRMEESGKQSQLKLERRKFQKEDLKTADMIIAATDSSAENSRIYKLCKQEGKLVNVVDVPAECDFIFPAIVKKKDLVVSVSTGGKSPLFAAKVKKELESRIPDYYGELVEILGAWRNRILTEVSDAKRRKRIFEALVEKGKKQHGKLPEKEIECVIKKEVQ